MVGLKEKYFSHFVIYPLILRILFPASPVTSKCIGSEWEQPYSKECLEFCNSKRKSEYTGTFHADCENPFPGNPGRVQNTCRWNCAENDCPCYSCPNGNYVICPAISKTALRKLVKLRMRSGLQNESASGSSEDSEDDGPPITTIAFSIGGAILGFIIIGLLAGWMYWHFRNKRNQRLVIANPPNQ